MDETHVHPAIYEVVITLKSGATITIDVTSLKTRYNGLGQLIAIDWTCPPDTETKKYRQLQYVDVQSIAAVVSQ